MMADKQSDQPYSTTGTTGPIYIPRSSAPKAVRPGETYFVVKIHGAQAAFHGSIWERVRQLLVTSQVALNHPALGPEPLRAIQRSREVRRNRAEQLGLSLNLINLVPATMDHVSISLEFVLDKENRLAVLGSLINDDAFLSIVSLAPGAATVARTIGGLSQKILQAFLQSEERQPILQFGGDFNIATGEFKDGYYVILGTRDEHNPLPRPMSSLAVKDGELMADGKPVTQWSYVILDVRCTEARTRDLNEGAAWDAKLREAEAIAQEMASDPFADEKKRRQTWDKCTNLIREGQVFLRSDPNYLYREAQDIITVAYTQGRQRIFGEEASRTLQVFKSLSLVQSDLRAERAFLDIPPDENLDMILDRYAEQVAQARRIFREGEP